MIKKPMKAPSKSISDEELNLLTYPIFGSPKLDGFRCVTNSAAYTSSLKLIQNAYVQSVLSDLIYSGFDGEIIVGEPNDPKAFANTTGAVRRFDGRPEFKYYVFDKWGVKSPYCERIKSLKDFGVVKVIEQKILNSPEEVIEYTNWCIDQGYEGAMIRSIDGNYKEGRCTLKELNIFKRKPIVDDEAVIISLEEQQENLNESFTNELGNTTRSSHKENKVGKNKLGAFIVKSKKWPDEFRIGTGEGLTDELRQEIWDDKEKYVGKIITYKYQEYGSINAPRQPIMKGFREKSDITDY